MKQFNTRKIREVQSRSLTSVIYDQLEQMILTGRIKPGERINESQLSSLLQVSRAPIREACRQLEKHGMVQSVARKGTFVTKIETSEVIELYDIRACLDALAAEKAAAHAAPQDLEDFRSMLQNMEAAIEADDVKKYYQTNIIFHRLIVELSRNKNLHSLIEGVYNKASLYRKTNLSFAARISISLSQHRDIFRAIEAGNPEQASSLMKHHVIDARNALLRSLESADTPADDLMAKDVFVYRK